MRWSKILVVAVGFAVCSLVGAVPAHATQGDWRIGVPVFSPKSGTSFTMLFSHFEPTSQQFLVRRYDAVGNLLTSQSLTIGANGTLQASPAANFGAPLTVQVWTEHPGLAVKVTYTDPGDVVRTIEPGDMRLLGPTAATEAGLGDVSAKVDTVNTAVGGLGTSLSNLASSVSGVDTKVVALDAKASATTTTLATLQGRLATLQRSVTGLRAYVTAMRSTLVTMIRRTH